MKKLILPILVLLIAFITVFTRNYAIAKNLSNINKNISFIIANPANGNMPETLNNSNHHENITISRGINNSSSQTDSTPLEFLDWWSDARYIFSVDTIAKIQDVKTGKTFMIKRTMGENHADCETLTIKDTKIMKSIWGGFSWERRPIIVYTKGRKIAASMSGMPHAGIDSMPAFSYTNNRSSGYGKGINLDVIKNNAMDGHVDIHFLNSTRHMDGKKDPDHQKCINELHK